MNIKAGSVFVVSFLSSLCLVIFAAFLVSFKHQESLSDVLFQLHPLNFIALIFPLLMGFLGIQIDSLRARLIDQRDLSLKFSEAQRTVGFGVWSFDLSTKKIEWSAELFRIFSQDPKNQEPSFEQFINFIHGDDRSLFLTVVKQAQESGTSFRIKHRIRIKDEIRWLECSGVAVRDENSTIKKLIGVCLDISNHIFLEQNMVDANKKLADQNTKLETLIQNTPGMVFSFSLNNQGDIHYSYVSSQVFDIYEIIPDDLTQDPLLLSKMVAPDQKESFAERLKECARTATPFHWVGRIISQSGKSKWIRAHAIPKTLQDASLHWDGVIVDITDEKKMEEDLLIERQKSMHKAKLASLGEMSAGIAHEINSPLAVISGTIVQLPKFINQPEKFNEKMATMSRSCDRISKIVQGLRKYSRTTDHQEARVFSLVGILNEVLVLTQPRSSRSQVEVRLMISDEAYILCDEIEIEQVFVNLVNNAIDAVKTLPSKWVEIELSATNQESIVKVRDSGEGIPLMIQEKLFDPFFTTKGREEGTGIGLSIVKTIIDQHNARIELDTRSRNTCFVVRFPKAEKPIEN